jgi:hypothetical protein
LIDPDLDVGEGAESLAGIFCIVAEAMAATKSPENPFLFSLVKPPLPSPRPGFESSGFTFIHVPATIEANKEVKDVVFDQTSLGKPGKRDFEGSLSFPQNENSQHRGATQQKARRTSRCIPN